MLHHTKKVEDIHVFSSHKCQSIHVPIENEAVPFSTGLTRALAWYLHGLIPTAVGAQPPLLTSSTNQRARTKCRHKGAIGFCIQSSN